MNTRALGLFAAVFVFALIAGASPLPTITVGPGSTIIDDRIFTFGAGSLEEWTVIDTTNPFHPGYLDFVFQLTETSGVIQTLDPEFLMGGPVGITTGFGSAGTEFPTSFTGSFNFGSGMFGSGMTVGTSLDLIEQTDTSIPWSAYLIVSGDGGSVTFNGAGPIPEPRTALLLGCLFVVALPIAKRFRVS